MTKPLSDLLSQDRRVVNVTKVNVTKVNVKSLQVEGRWGVPKYAP